MNILASQKTKDTRVDLKREFVLLDDGSTTHIAVFFPDRIDRCDCKLQHLLTTNEYLIFDFWSNKLLGKIKARTMAQADETLKKTKLLSDDE